MKPFSKTLLILGGSRYIMPVIEAAHDLECKVVTCDYLPHNYAHAFSDEYVNASIVDKEAILDVARAVHADGITSFAADPGVTTAAYVAEQLGLPFQGSYEAVCTLQNKNLFRAFLCESGFTCPRAFEFSSREDAEREADGLPYPLIAKPIDSAGSKGVTRVDGPESLSAAIDHALQFSLSGKCIVEQFIEKDGPSSDADSFTVDGRLECISFTDQLFDVTGSNPYVPSAYAMPSSMAPEHQIALRQDVQRVVDLLGLKTGIYNIESRVGKDGLPYIMELSPRGGGNRLAEMLRYAAEIDMIRASVAASVGLPVENISMPVYQGFWYQQMLHTEVAGVFRGIEYAPGFKEAHVKEEQLWIEPGTTVQEFTSANYAFGSVFLHFDTQEELASFRSDPDQQMKVIVS